MKITKIVVKSKHPGSKTVAPHSPHVQAAIQMKAYELYLQRNGAPGDPAEDWITAEKLILKKS
jgi:Protein of unknown function (DUF2934)